jgi:hypothetical protein
LIKGETGRPTLWIMTGDDLGDAVVALRFDDLAVADELATWCGGEVVKRVDVALADEQARTVILVPTDRGPRPAHFGDWIVRRGKGDHHPYTPEEFALLHEPLL